MIMFKNFSYSLKIHKVAKMDHFKPYNIKLIEFYESIINNEDSTQLAKIVNLDLADDTLRDFLSINEMREAGSFFTGQALSEKAVSRFTKPITLNSVVLDPTCGTGNLLLACSRQLDISITLSETLRNWGRTLRGYDIHASFVEASKLRIVLEALNRGAHKDCTILDALTFLPGFEVVDALEVTADMLREVTHLIMNPPFSNWNSPEFDYWKKGKVNAAGVVFDHYLRNLPELSEISAVLPDVLRSGSRYGNWRTFTSSHISAAVEVAGRFNKKTDIDVFLLYGTVTSSSDSETEWFPQSHSESTIATRFDVCIGPLVAYRDPLEGVLAPYIHSKNTPAWETFEPDTEYRLFRGRLIQPPFVVVRRTSSPSDRYRALGAIVIGNKAIAVENHLIVIKPKNAKISDCNKLITTLKNKKTNDLINDRIRCRHLTVGIVKEIPIW